MLLVVELVHQRSKLRRFEFGALFLVLIMVFILLTGSFGYYFGSFVGLMK
jgi:hypothetical protein